jgi:hypothetical protein
MARSHAAPNTMRGRLSPARLSAQRASRRGFQIGPRIRVGGTIGQIGQNVKNAVTKGVTDVGHTVGQIADNPWTKAAVAAGLAATGVGAPAAAAILGTMGAGGALLKPGGNIGGAVKGGVTGAVEGYGAGKLGAALHGAGGVGAAVRAIPGVTGVLGPVAGASTKGIPGGGVFIPGGAGDVGQLPAGTPSGGGTPWDQILGAITGSGSSNGSGSSGGSGGGIDWGAILGNIGGFVQDHGTDLAAGGLATAQALAAAKASQRAGTLQDKALGLAESNWAQGEPLRTQGRTRLLSPVKPDLTSTYTDPTNPFARVRRVA